MFGKIKNIIAGSKSKKNKKESKHDSGIKKTFVDLGNVISGLASDTINDIKLMRVKSKNLLQTNINLAMKHLNNDRVSDAILRLKIINLFWPKYSKAYYYLAHCYILKQKQHKAKATINKLLELDPSYKSKVSNMIKVIEGNENE